MPPLPPTLRVLLFLLPARWLWLAWRHYCTRRADEARQRVRREFWGYD